MQPTQGNCTGKIKRLPIFEQERDLAKYLEVNFTESLKQMIKVTVKTMVREEMEEFRKGFEEKLYFNGTYGRNMISSFGRIDDIPVPRFRQTAQTGGFTPQTLSVFEQEREKFERLVTQMHLLGISQRKIKHLAHVCFGVPVSANKVGSIYKELVEKEAADINHHPLTDEYQYLLLDGLWEVTKGYGWEDNKSVILAALGVKPDGKRQVLGFVLARHEDRESWKELLLKLKSRGLLGKRLDLVISDDNPAAKNAVAQIYPGIKVQNCIVHKMRNVFGKASRKNKTALAEDLKSIFRAESRDEALEKTRNTVKKWYMVEPKAMESLRFNIGDCFTYFEFPREIWRRIRTTNILEREFREVRRRMKVFDNTFQNPESANRYTNSIFDYLNCNYPLKGGLHTNS